MSKFKEYLIETVVDTIHFDDELRINLPLSKEAVKEIIEKSLYCETGDNVLLAVGPFLSSMPIAINSGAVDAACKDAWESIDWEALTEEINAEIVRIM